MNADKSNVHIRAYLELKFEICDSTNLMLYVMLMSTTRFKMSHFAVIKRLLIEPDVMFPRRTTLEGISEDPK